MAEKDINSAEQQNEIGTEFEEIEGLELENTDTNLSKEENPSFQDNPAEESSQENQISEDDQNNESTSDETPEEKPDEQPESDKEEKSGESEKEEKEKEDEESKYTNLQKKTNTLRKNLILAAGILIAIVILGSGLYIYGFFDQEEEAKSQKVDTNTTKTQQIEPKVEENKYKFDPKDINEKRLNKKLALLTKYQIIEDEEIKPQKQKEFQKKVEIDKKSVVQAKIEKDQNITKTVDTNITKTIPEQTIDNNITKDKTLDDQKKIKESESNVTISTVQDTNMTIEDSEKYLKSDNNKSTTIEQKASAVIEDEITEKITPLENQYFLKFIQVATLKYKLFNSFLKELEDIDARISICKDQDNRTQIFIGPFKDNNKRDIIIKQINEHIVTDAFAVELTKEEFDNRCNF